MCKVVKAKGALQEAVENLYAVFGRYSAPKERFDVCSCCMDARLEQEMRRKPLRSLGQWHLYDYIYSVQRAKDASDEVKYLLPRWLELLAQGAFLHHAIELCLQRLGSCPATAFSTQERAAVDAFALAFFAEGLAQSPRSKKGLFQGNGAFAILLMFDYGGVALGPLLDHWAKVDTPESTMHYVWSNYWDYCAQNGVYANDRPGYCELMKGWLTHAENVRRFADRVIVLLDSQEFAREAANDGACRPGTDVMVNAVFDRMVLTV